MLEMINQSISIHWETASIHVQLAIHCKKTMGGELKKICLERVVRNYFSWCYI